MTNDIRIYIEVDGDPSLGTYQAIQRMLGTHNDLPNLLFEGQGTTTITLQVSTEQLEVDENFKKAVAELPNSLSVNQFQSSDLYLQYKQTLSKTQAALLQTSFISIRRFGCPTLGDIRGMNVNLILAARNIDKKRANLLAWLFDLK